MKLNVVQPRAGLEWVRLGMRTFLRQPLALSGLFFMYVALVMVASLVPVLGPLIGGALMPAMTLGLMAASAEADRGRFPMPGMLFSAFRAGRERQRAMLVLGAIYAGGSMAASALATLLAGAPQPPVQGQAPQLDPAMALTLVLHLPLFLMFWHAPALVHWYAVAPVKSLFFSLVAIWRNFGAHAVYTLAWLGVFLGVGTGIGMLGAMIGGAGTAQAVMMPAALLLAAMFTTSLFFSFRACFQGDAAPGLPDTEKRQA